MLKYSGRLLDILACTLGAGIIASMLYATNNPAPSPAPAIDKTATFNNGTEAPMRIEVTLDPGESLKVPDGLDVHVHMIVYED